MNDQATPKLDLDTLLYVRKKVEQFARREWKHGNVQRSDIATDLLDDVDDLIEEANNQRTVQSQKFQRTLTQVRETYQLLQTHCVGCSVMKTEGPRSYEALVDVDDKGRCTVCRKPRYKKP